MKYLIILEPTEKSYSAYSPDLDGCVVADGNRDDRTLRPSAKIWLGRVGQPAA